MRHMIFYGLFFLMVQKFHHHFLQKMKNLRKMEKRVTSFSPFSCLDSPCLHHHFLHKRKRIKKMEKRVSSFSPFSSLAFYPPSVNYGVEKSVMVFSALVVMASV
ncbi:hypothetical protein DD594_25515 [Enterobacter cloacae complex sp. 4DZ1-17B1]|nr:hypothetical protein DD594_25515 [Enterobacter cloacae complex sp. 4DZ1-17B1]